MIGEQRFGVKRETADGRLETGDNRLQTGGKTYQETRNIGSQEEDDK
jgi:hypothetical protein